jgi:hypothetical protein
MRQLRAPDGAADHPRGRACSGVSGPGFGPALDLAATFPVAEAADHPGSSPSRPTGRVRDRNNFQAPVVHRCATVPHPLAGKTADGGRTIA